MYNYTGNSHIYGCHLYICSLRPWLCFDSPGEVLFRKGDPAEAPGCQKGWDRKKPFLQSRNWIRWMEICNGPSEFDDLQLFWWISMGEFADFQTKKAEFMTLLVWMLVERFSEEAANQRSCTTVEALFSRDVKLRKMSPLSCLARPFMWSKKGRWDLAGKIWRACWQTLRLPFFRGPIHPRCCHSLLILPMVLWLVNMYRQLTSNVLDLTSTVKLHYKYLQE